jgi:cytochrome c oxidase subunit 1/cytochrome c oxidase subunit I+III
LINVFVSLRSGQLAGPNPWDAPTLEWSVPSPAPVYNFAVIPVVASRHPLWEDRLNESPERSSLTRGYLLDQGRETLATTVLDAEPDLILKMPGDSYAPLVLALALSVLFVGLILHSAVCTGLGAFAIVMAILVWLWPQRRLGQVGEPTHV